MAYEPGKFPERIIAVDYDGTMVPDQFPDHPEVTDEMRASIARFRELGYHVLINTSRDSLEAPKIAENTGIPEVHTGKPIADLYLDDKGLLPEPHLLEAFVEQYFETQLDYLHKLTAGELTSPYATNIANVPENPEYHEVLDDKYRVYIPLTGGMDSTTLWQMGVESGVALQPIYLRCGQDYADLEEEKASELAEKAGYQLEVVDLQMPFKKFDYILLGRNAAVIYTIASLMKERGQWGEIWFGNLAGESPIHNGDKSRRFFNDTQALLSLRGFDVRVCNPLIGMDKPDEVAFWTSRDIETLVDTKSCFSTEHNQCGECQTCFRKWAAFAVHGRDVSDTFANQDVRISFQPFIDKYKSKMGKALADQNFAHYSPSRISTTLRAIDILETTK